MCYVVQHPDATDTLEGIAEWWLLEQRVQASVAEVKAGLDRLVAGGQLVAEQNADGTVYYRWAKAARKQYEDHFEQDRTN